MHENHSVIARSPDKSGRRGNLFQNAKLDCHAEFTLRRPIDNWPHLYILQGWNHQVELVRPLRGQAGRRQVPDAEVAQYLSDAGGECVSIIYRRV